MGARGEGDLEEGDKADGERDVEELDAVIEAVVEVVVEVFVAFFGRTAK